MSLRVIPRLDIKGPNLVKGVHMEGLRVLGKPERFARYYYEQGADELIYMDAVASLYGRNNLLHIVERTAREILIPLCVGGGLRSVEDIRTVLRAGADKVSLNTAAILRPQLIREAARAFGSSTIVVSLDVVRHADGRYECNTDYGRESSGLDPFLWAQQAVELGAGELLVTAINQEGTGAGYDIELIRRIAESVPVPVIACGGAGRLDHVVEVVEQGRADAVCMASLLHYHAIRHAEHAPSDFAEEGNIEFLARGRDSKRIDDVALPVIKRRLRDAGVDCRTDEQAV